MLLISRGAAVDAMAGAGDEPILHTVCYAPAGGGSADVRLQKLALLLDHGAAADSMNDRGESALDVALFQGGIQVVSLLLRHRATSTMATADGGCILHAAALAGRADVLEVALSSLAAIGVDLNQQDATGRTPLHVAVGCSDASLVAPLLRMKASTEVQADDGCTPLRLAVAQGDLAIVRALLAVGGAPLT